MTPTRKRWLTRLGVAVVGLGALGFTGYRWTRRIPFPSPEYTRVLQDLRVAEEAHRAETGAYLGCDERGSHTTDGQLETAPFFPRGLTELDDRKLPFSGVATPVGRCFDALGVRTDGRVYLAYAVVAHGGEEPWFEARAVGDRDSDGNRVEYRISSRTRHIEVVDDDD